MAQSDIVDKLNEFFKIHAPVSEQCHVVYIMVEIRKILDHSKDHWQRGSFTLLRFYCDWTVHTEKTRITESMETVMNEVYKDVKEQLENPAMTKAMSPVMKFAYMENLRSEMRCFFKKHEIDISLTKEELWIPFIGLLIKILENQPIHKPNNKISEFSFLPAADRCVYGFIQFSEVINGRDHYTFGNAF